jgi:hypothetical protein
MTDSRTHGWGRTSFDAGWQARQWRWTLLGVAVFGSACSDAAVILPYPVDLRDSSPPVDSSLFAEPGSAAPPEPAAPIGPDPGVSSDVDASATSGGPDTASDSSDDPVPMGPGGAGLIDGSAPPLRGAIALADAELAHQALTLMGSSAVGGAGSCSTCHALGRPTLTHWQSLTDAFSAACLTDTALGDVPAVDQMVGCFHAQAAPAPGLSTANFGIYAAAAHLPWFSFVFEHASEFADDWQAHHAQFVGSAGMPRAGTRWTQGQFDLVAEWFARGLPLLFELVPEEDGEPCAAGLDPRLHAHVESMRTAGWKARNEQVPLLMFGCSDGQATAACLGQVPLAADVAYGAGWDVPGGAQIHVLYDNTGAPTNYWSRSSADGRYFASGLRASGDPDFSGQFLDLQLGQLIEGNFAYDPTFFPDNSGFLVQRSGYSESSGPTDGSADPSSHTLVCNQSVLGGTPLRVNGDEPGCTQLDGQIGLYQQLARSLDGDDYWVIYGSFDEDNGGFAPVHENPSAAFDGQSSTTFVPMINTGTAFLPGTPSRVVTPLAGDPMLSPSGRLLVTRRKGRESTSVVGGNRVVRAEQSGYALHLVTTTESGDTLTPSLSDVGRICLQGGKAVVSYDERWLVLHHYVTASDAVELGYTGPDDPAFASYQALGASNLYLVDLQDGSSRPITHMSPGQYALFPHFRSDGWIYFVVRTDQGEEYFSATNAAVLLGSPN